MSDLEEVKEEFKSQILKTLKVLPKTCNEKDVRKCYRELFGCNINNMIDKLGAGNVFNFLRFQCKSICEVFVNDGDIKILRLENDQQTSPEDAGKSKKKKQKAKKISPKLNFPRVGIINQNTFPRLNPQGYNKSKPINSVSKQLSSLSFYQAPNVYRPASQLKNFCHKDDEEENLETQEEAEDEFYLAREMNFEEEKENFEEPPEVLNPFDFPTLPGVQEVEERQEVEEEVENYEEQEVYEDCQEVYEDCHEDFQEFPLGIDEFLLSTDELDDPIFRINFPEVITAPNFSIPQPKIKFLPEKHLFEVHLTKIFSPTQFWFQFGDEALSVLMWRMNEFYEGLPAGDLVLSDGNMKKGLVVAAKIFNVWHRAVIASEPNDNEEMFLFFVDFGTIDSMNWQDVRYLLKRFADEPVKALRGCLIGCKPKFCNENWDKKSREVFFDFVADKKLYAQMRFHRDDDNVYELELQEQITIKTGIADKMIRAGFADEEEIEDEFQFAVPMSFADKKINAI